MERKRCLVKGKQINNTSNDAKDVYYASKYFIQISEVLEKDAHICTEFPLLIDYYYKNVTVNNFSAKMVPLQRKIENTKNQYKTIAGKNYSKGVASLYGTFVEEILGDAAEA